MLKKFEYWANGKRVRLEILEKVTDTKMKVNVTVDGKELARETTASICRINNKPDKLYLSFNDTFLTICDMSKAGFIGKSREIADWIWENIQDKSDDSTLYGFTSN